MKTDEIRGKNDHELNFELDKAKAELFDLRFKSKTQSLPNPQKIRSLRREIATIHTIVHERKTGVRGQEPR
ncbi:MAG: 50S ribosomal protein L29 [Planctomycetes bacterium]|nr:50S ribosomal protein L29 [Planctomycetota bacterium]